MQGTRVPQKEQSVPFVSGSEEKVAKENAFGKLIQKYRKKRGWTQEEVAQRWDHSREYLSAIERGKRKLEKPEQVARLADLLGIPAERLQAVGKTLPHQPLRQSDDLLLQAIIGPAQDSVKLSWLLWQENTATLDLETQLQTLEHRLVSALSLYRGHFRGQVFHLLASTYEMLGKMAIERTSTQEAMAHFREMQDIAEEIGSVDLLVKSLIHQAEMFRRRGWYETSFRRMHAASHYLQDREKVGPVPPGVKIALLKAFAITYFVNGDEQPFQRSIDTALTLAETLQTTLDSLGDELSTVDLLQTQAQGYTMLWQPEKALSLYRRTDTLRPHRTLRDQCSYTIIQAQAHCYVEDTTTGVQLARLGIEQAETLHSIRYVVRVQQMSDRLHVTPLGEQRELKELRATVFETLQRMRGEH